MGPDSDTGASPLVALSEGRFLSLVFRVALLASVCANTVWLLSAMDGLKDLDSFLHSAAAYARGMDPYEYYWWLKPEPISSDALNLNPPISVYLFQPLIAVDRGLLGTVFVLGSVALVALAVLLLMRAYPEKRSWLLVLVVASMAGVWQLLWYVQIYAPLILAVTGAWLLLRRGTPRDLLLAGALIGLVIAVKPNYGLVALVLLAAGHYRPGVAAIGTAAAISVVPLLLDGPGIYRQWLQMTTGFDGYEWTSNASLVSVGARFGLPSAGQAVAMVTAAGALGLARVARPGRLDALTLGLLAVLLIGPVSWAGYTLLLLPFLFSMRWDRWTWCAVALLAAPFAPARVIAALGLQGGAIAGPAAAVMTLVPSFLTTALGALLVPLVEAVYAWALLILAIGLVRRLVSNRPDAGHGNEAASGAFPATTGDTRSVAA